MGSYLKELWTIGVSAMSQEKNSNNTNRSTSSQASEDSPSPSNGSTLGEIAASLRADFHAKTSQPPAKEQDSKATEVDYGGKRLPPSAWFDRSSSSWRMFQHCLLEGWTLFSGRWPRSGIVSNGIAYQLDTLAHRTKGSASGLSESEMWPTPMTRGYSNASEGQLAIFQRKVGKGELTEEESSAMMGGCSLRPPRVKMLPTPTAGDSRNSGRHTTTTGKSHSGTTLVDAVKMWPTPSASDHKGSGPTLVRKDGKDRSFDRLDYASELVTDKGGGALSADWVSILRGYSLDWTTIVEDGSAEFQGSQEGKKTGSKD